MDIRDAGAFADYWDNVRARTLRVAEAIPADRIEWAPAPGRWSLGDILRHLGGIEREMYAENVAGRPSRYAGHDPGLAAGREAVLDYLGRMHAEAQTIFRSLTPARLEEKCLTPAGIPITVKKWLRAMVEHEAHHRGQIYLMLGLLGVPTPPIFGLTEEEVRARSATR